MLQMVFQAGSCPALSSILDAKGKTYEPIDIGNAS